MSDSLEQRIAGALESVRAPQGAKERALAAIEAARPVDAVAGVASRLPQRSRFPRRHGAFLAAAACLVIGAVGFGGYRLYIEPVAYVGIDVNPSVELSVNRLDRVVGARAVNEDGATVLAEASLQGCSYDEALDRLMESQVVSRCLQVDGVVEISVTADDERIADQLMRASDEALAQHQCHGGTFCADGATRQAAAAAGMGTARYQAACDLMALDDSVTLEECAQLPMAELRERIAACQEEGSDQLDAGVAACSHGKGHGRRHHGA